jgi:Uma2 family endonuclease
MTMVVQQVPDRPQPFRFSREEYYQMGELGFFEGHRVELIEGEIVEMAPMNDLHAVTVGIVAETLAEAFPECWIRSQLPLTLAGATEPEPELAVVPGRPRDYKGRGHPKSALLVVEIADTSLRFDREEKAVLYARAGIKDFWIVNLVENQLEVLRDPVKDSKSPVGWRYRTVTTLGPEDQVVPLGKPEAVIRVAELLP